MGHEDTIGRGSATATPADRGHGKLPELAAAAIRDMILADELSPGERVPEHALATRLGISRTPLREALKLVAAEGLLDLAPNRGAVVANPGPGEIRDMVQVMAVLEALAAELACQKASDGEIAELRALTHEMHAAYVRRDRPTYFRLNQSIHLGIIAAARNPALAETHARLNARCYRVLYMSNERSERWHLAVQDHERMAELLAARDEAALSALARRHRAVVWDEVNPRLADGPAPARG